VNQPVHIDKEKALRAFGLFLQAVRVACGLSIEELAHLAGVDKTTVWRIENGQQEAGWLLITKFALALEVQLCVLACGCPNCLLRIRS